MSPNHSLRHALGTGVCALAVCAAAVTAGLLTGNLAIASVPAPTTTTLTSVGTGGGVATAQSTRPAISENGRYVAFNSQAALKVSASVPAAAAPSASAWRVYVRDETRQATSLLSDPGAGNATAPSISGNGKLVSYLLDDGTGSNVVVVNRQATGKGAFDTRANLAVTTVTGTFRDLPFERIPECPTGIGAHGAVRTTPCGPRLSADGTTLVYQARLSPVSPALAVMDDGPVDGNLIDFGVDAPDSAPFGEQVDYLVRGSQPVTFTGITTTGPFTASTSSGLITGAPGCTGTVRPGMTCGVHLAFNPTACPASGTAMVTGTLRTNATTPAGQSSVTLVALCDSALGEEEGPAPATAVPRPPAGCSAPAKGLPVVQAPAQEQDNNEANLTDFGPAVIGQPYVAKVGFTAPSSESSPPASWTLQFTSRDCGIQLVSPASLGLPADRTACTEDESLAASASCTAYLLVTPSAVGTGVASLIAAAPDDPSSTQVGTYLTVTGVSDVIIARHDKTGAGRFAASASTVVSVNGQETVIPGASQPSVSATGRYVAFTAPAGGGTSIWRHDTDAAGNRTYRSGPTILVSCLSVHNGGCFAPPEAGSPSLSGDGSQVAFATIAAHGQIYVRNVTAGTSTLVSAPASGKAGATANGDSYAPVMSQDGSTVAYISTATDLAARVTPAGAANLFVRTVSPGGPAASELVSPSGVSLPAGDDIALPAVDAHGGLITAQTSQRLLPAAPRGVVSVYTFGRLPELAPRPSPVAFGIVMAGTAKGSRTVTVTDTGPGPGMVTGAGTTGPFGIKEGSCAGAVLHDGGRCTLVISLIPRQAGTDRGTLTVTVTGDAGTEVSASVPVAATVEAEAARLSVSPGVAPPGQAARVTGSGFLPGQGVTLSWAPGLGQASVTVSRSGSVAAVMVIFPDDLTGPRVLRARDESGQVLATVNFLVQQPSAEPPFTAAGPPG